MTLKLRPLILALPLAAAMSIASPAQAVVIDNTDPEFSSSTGGGVGAGVVILMYHGLDGPHGHNPANFTTQMQYLADNGFTTITLDDLVSWIETGSPALPEKPIVLTFDDDYITVYSVAYSEMQSRGFFGYNFAHTRYVGVAPPGPPATSYDHADWIEINEMENAGVLFTESHTVSHTDLTSLAPAAEMVELVDSKTAIEDNIAEKTVRYLAYPFGTYDADTITAAELAGYVASVTTIPGVNTRATPLHELRRENVTPSTAQASYIATVNQASGGSGGPWASSTSEPEFFGTDYQVSAAGSGQEVATWAFTLPADGMYEVSVWYTDHANRASNAPYTVVHSGGSETVRVDQRTSGGDWVSLGSWSFDASVPHSVTLTDDADGFVIADAVRMELVSAVVPVGLTILGAPGD